jgi:hypothetical protein
MASVVGFGQDHAERAEAIGCVISPHAVASDVVSEQETLASKAAEGTAYGPIGLHHQASGPAMGQPRP